MRKNTLYKIDYYLNYQSDKEYVFDTKKYDKAKKRETEKPTFTKNISF